VIDPRDVFLSGGTGYLGTSLIPVLLARGHRVRALTRGAGPPGVDCVRGNALEASTFAASVAPADTVVHLVGVSHPAPWKAGQFEAVDVASVRATLTAARQAGIAHLVYLSVAQPAPMMRAYLAARARCEALIRDSGVPSSFLRPWYVLGPGHRWPHLLRPMYALAERVPALRPGALRLGLVTLPEMTAALVWTVEHPVAPGASPRVIDVPALRQLGRGAGEAWPAL
jgi:uncharacterized protein YbjT (DUF2867 family)